MRKKKGKPFKQATSPAKRFNPIKTVPICFLLLGPGPTRGGKNGGGGGGGGGGPL